MEQRAAMKFCEILKETATKMSEALNSSYGEELLSRTYVFEWHERLKKGSESERAKIAS
jgi:hypothetical protein